MRKLLLATSSLVPLGLLPALANPLGPQVVGGAATVQGTSTPKVTVTQSSQNAVINWNSFNIGAGETTQFVQPNSSASVLNRVTGDSNPSQIFGTLSANGRVFVVNPNGVLVGSSGIINTAGFLATTHDIKNDDFMAGRYDFTISGRPDASVVNLGSINATNSGFAALVAPGVRNSGTITATLGKIGLASGNGFSLDFYGDKLISLGVSDSVAASVKDVASGKTLSSLVHNDGTLKANGGRVELSAVTARQIVDSVINTSGVIEARSVGQRNGKIVLGAPTADMKVAGTPPQVVKVSGRLNVSSKRATGGTILVTGEDIRLAGADVDASGRTGGGKVLIGGDTGGGVTNPAVAAMSKAGLESYSLPSATTVLIDAATTIDVSAKKVGDGGKVVVWSDQITEFYGSIFARGGRKDGNGGFVETSGHALDVSSAKVDTSAVAGRTGNWLLDPYDLTINFSAAATISSNLANSNVTVETTSSGYNGPGVANTGSGDITVAANISWNTPNILTLSAYRNIIVSNGVTISNASPVTFGVPLLRLRADNTGTDQGTVTFSGTGKIDFTATSFGWVEIYYNPSGGYAHPTDYTSAIAAPISAAWMLINNVHDLQNINQNLSGRYVLGSDIDATGFSFIPIGTQAAPFTGSFFGTKPNISVDPASVGEPNVGATIANLTINSAANAVGLFGYSTGYINRIGLNNAHVTGTASGASVGGVVGVNSGIVALSYVTGSVSGPATGSVGGLVGSNLGGFVLSDYSLATVSGHGVTGGLIGSNSGSFFVQNVYAAGAVSGTGTLGGLIGSTSGSSGTLSDAYWDGQTTGQFASGGGVRLATSGLKALALFGAATDPSINSGYPYIPQNPPLVTPPPAAPPALATPDQILAAALASLTNQTANISNSDPSLQTPATNFFIANSILPLIPTNVSGATPQPSNLPSTNVSAGAIPSLVTIGDITLMQNTLPWTGVNMPLSASDLVKKIQTFVAFSDAAYHPTDENSWTQFATQMHLSPGDVALFKAWGFDASIFKQDGRIVVAFAGSALSITNVPATFADWVGTNIPNSLHLGGTTADQFQYLVGYALTLAVKNSNPDIPIYLTGHSLGGGIAAYVGASLNLPAITFNPAGITVSPSQTLNTKEVLNFRIQGDPAGFGGSTIGTTVVVDDKLLSSNASVHDLNNFVDIAYSSFTPELAFRSTSATQFFIGKN